MGAFDVDPWLELLSSLRRNKLRALLTACGIFWGVFMLVILLGFGRGLEAGVNRTMLGFTSNAVAVWPYRTELPYKGLPPGRWLRFDNSDTATLQQGLSGIVGLSPVRQLGGWQNGVVTTRGARTGAFGVMGEHPIVADIEGLSIVSGRFLNPADVAERRKVVVIGSNARAILFDDNERAVGEYIKIQGVHFVVIGVVSSDLPGERGERANTTLHIPLSTLQGAFNAPNAVGWFSILAQPDADAKLVEEQAKRILGARHSVHPEDGRAVGSYNAGEDVGRVRRLFSGIRIFIWIVSVATLCAGALGVSNIMLVSVKERTREIGVRKALGATPWSIVSMIMREAMLLTAIAGYVGLVAGVLLLEAARILAEGSDGPLAAPGIDLGVGLLTVGVLALVGLAAGIVPARHAAKIHPVVALRYE